MVDLALEALREMQQALEAADQIGFTEPHVELLDAAPQSSYDTYHSRRDPAVHHAAHQHSHIIPAAECNNNNISTAVNPSSAQLMSD